MALYKKVQVTRVRREKVRAALLKTHPEHCKKLIQWCFEGEDVRTYRRVQTKLERANFWKPPIYLSNDEIEDILAGAII